MNFAMGFTVLFGSLFALSALCTFVLVLVVTSTFLDTSYSDKEKKMTGIALLISAGTFIASAFLMGLVGGIG